MKSIPSNNSHPAREQPTPVVERRRPGSFLRGVRTIIIFLMAFYVFIWVINVFGVSTIFNDPEIYYSGINANTGERVVVKGCRPERLRPDGSCNKSIDLPTIIEAIPRWSR